MAMVAFSTSVCSCQLIVTDFGFIDLCTQIDPGNHFLLLGVQNRLINVDESIYIPITKGEFAVIVSTFNVSSMSCLIINLSTGSSLQLPCFCCYSLNRLHEF